jgi:predicted esterase
MKGECCLVFLHGSGSNGDDIFSYLDNVPLPDFNFRSFAEVAKTMSITLVTPTAATRAYSAMGGEHCNVWFDRSADFIDCGMNDLEDTAGVNSSLRALESDLNYLNDEFEHVFFGGFSMGGGLALHILRKPFFSKLRGVFTMGSFLTEDSALLTKPVSKVPVLMMHGTSFHLL